MAPVVQKSSGAVEPFDQIKLRQSMERAGAPAQIAERVIGQVVRALPARVASETLYYRAQSELRRYHPVSATKYGLKRAVMRLGPAGYRFERYVALLLEADGYETQVGRTVQGACVAHEVDVLARRGDEHLLVECKFHQQPGTRSDVKVALYTYARFQDVAEGLRRQPNSRDMIHEAWLITNTKCTVDATRYARCRGLRVMAWRYPENQGLEALIERHRLYPMTILPSVTAAIVERFGQANLVTVRDLVEMSAESLMHRFHLKPTTADALLADAYALVA